MSTHFLITGMFRSGTTMLARMLHANKNIICASDPFAPIFKSFRNSIASRLGDVVDTNAPFHDYYFDETQNRTFQEIQKIGFKVPFELSTTNHLQSQVREHCSPYSPLVHPHLKNLRGSTYSELFQNGFEILKQAYPKLNSRAIGFKEVWVDEFSPHFQGMIDGNKVIHIIRDPRSVVASNFASGGAYPLLFLARQWRKLASLGWLYSSNNSNVKLIFFEDLIQSPEKTAMDICVFLGVDYCPKMIDSDNFKDGLGNRWIQNSSFRNADQSKNINGFNPNSIDKWRQTLSSEVVKTIEQLCFFEMTLVGYKKINKFHVNESNKMNTAFKDDVSSIAEWIKPHTKYNSKIEMLLEQARHDDIILKRSVSEHKQRAYALSTEIYNAHINSAVPLK